MFRHFYNHLEFRILKVDIIEIRCKGLGIFITVKKEVLGLGGRYLRDRT